jgi:hypothetical protein
MGSSGLMLSFGLAEECSSSVLVDRHYGSLLACLTLYTEVAYFFTETGYFDTLAYSVSYDTFEDHYRVYLFIYFYLMLGMGSFGTVCIVVDSFG